VRWNSEHNEKYRAITRGTVRHKIVRRSASAGVSHSLGVSADKAATVDGPGRSAHCRQVISTPLWSALCRRTRHDCVPCFASSCVPNDVNTASHTPVTAVLCCWQWKRWPAISDYSTETGAWLDTPLFATVTSQRRTFQGMTSGLPSWRKNRRLALDCRGHQYFGLTLIHILTIWRHRRRCRWLSASRHRCRSLRSRQPVLHGIFVKYQRPNHHC